MKIDIKSPKVFTPAILFTLAALLVPVGNKNALMMAAIGFTILNYIIITYFTNIKTMTTADVIVPVLLFLALMPGVLLTIPPGSRGLFMSQQSSTTADLVHGVVYAVVYAFLRGNFPSVY